MDRTLVGKVLEESVKDILESSGITFEADYDVNSTFGQIGLEGFDVSELLMRLEEDNRINVNFDELRTKINGAYPSVSSYTGFDRLTVKQVLDYIEAYKSESGKKDVKCEFDKQGFCSNREGCEYQEPLGWEGDTTPCCVRGTQGKLEQTAKETSEKK